MSEQTDPNPSTDTETDCQSPMADTGPRLDVVCARCSHHADHHGNLHDIDRPVTAPITYGACRWKECDCSCLVCPATDQVLADRPPPSRPSRTIMPLNIDRETERLLEHLVASGLWGRSVEEAAERVLCHGLSDLLATPVLEHTRTELHGRQRRHVGSA